MDDELVIDLDNSHTLTTGDKNSTVFNSTTSATDFVFTASSAGTFAFFCYLHGYATQHGTLKVEAATATPSGDNTLLIVGGVIVVVIIVGAAPATLERIHAQATKRRVQGTQLARREGPPGRARVFHRLGRSLGAGDRDDMRVAAQPGQSDLCRGLTARLRDPAQLSDERRGPSNVHGFE